MIRTLIFLSFLSMNAMNALGAEQDGSSALQQLKDSPSIKVVIDRADYIEIIENKHGLKRYAKIQKRSDNNYSIIELEINGKKQTTYTREHHQWIEDMIGQKTEKANIPKFGTTQDEQSKYVDHIYKNETFSSNKLSKLREIIENPITTKQTLREIYFKRDTLTFDSEKKELSDVLVKRLLLAD